MIVCVCVFGSKKNTHTHTRLNSRLTKIGHPQKCCILGGLFEAVEVGPVVDISGGPQARRRIELKLAEGRIGQLHTQRPGLRPKHSSQETPFVVFEVLFYVLVIMFYVLCFEREKKKKNRNKKETKEMRDRKKERNIEQNKEQRTKT